MAGSGLPKKISTGDALVAADLVENFQALQLEVNALEDRNFELGAINTRHLPEFAGANLRWRQEFSTWVDSSVTASVWTSIATLGPISLTDGGGLEGLNPIFCMAPIDVWPFDATGAAGYGIGNGLTQGAGGQMGTTTVGARYEFKLAHKWDKGLPTETAWLGPGVGPITERWITPGSENTPPERNQVVLCSPFSPLPSKKNFSVRLEARAMANSAGVIPLTYGYARGRLQAFYGVR